MSGKNATLFGMLLFGAVLLTGCMATDQGTLAGRVTIGPLCPVEPCNVTQDQLSAALSTRTVVVYSLNQGDVVAIARINRDGSYSVQLAPGSYIIDINHIGIDRSRDVPNQVTIIPGGTTTLNISIDTGLR